MTSESGIEDQGLGRERRSSCTSRCPLPLCHRPSILKALCLAGLLYAHGALAGAQIYTPLSASVRTVLQHSISDQAADKTAFDTHREATAWLNEMSRRLATRWPDKHTRIDFLKSVHYEAARAGLDPQLVLGLIEVESGFNKYAVSRAGARGYMQVMPFWIREIGAPGHNLFHLRTNLRYGCTILRYYIDLEKGDLFRALGRYNGSLGKAKYPNAVRSAWRNHWSFPQRASSRDNRSAASGLRPNGCGPATSACS